MGNLGRYNADISHYRYTGMISKHFYLLAFETPLENFTKSVKISNLLLTITSARSPNLHKWTHFSKGQINHLLLTASIKDNYLVNF